MKIISFFIYLFITTTAVSIFGSEKVVIGGIDGLDPYSQEKTYPVLLALSGGGARGLAIIGILKAFEDKNIEIVGISGTSMGGIIGGLYASGYSPKEIEDIAEDLNFNTLFSNSPPRNSMFLTKKEENEKHLLSIRFNKFKPVLPKALTAGQELTSLLTRLTTKANYKCGADFSKLPIPFLTISTDIVTGKQVILQNGSIAEAMRSTMAFPLAFTGVEVDNMILMDGGIVTPIPVELARTLSTKTQFVVAVNTSSKLAKKEEIKNPIDIANQVTSIMTKDKLQTQLAKADCVLEPPIDSYLSSHFDKKDSLVEIGYQYGLKKADSIIQKLLHRQSATIYNIAQIHTESLSEQEIEFLKPYLLNRELSMEDIINTLKGFVYRNNYFTLNILLENTQSDSTKFSQKVLKIDGYKNFSPEKIQIQFSGNTIFTNQELTNLFTTNSSYITPKVIKNGIEQVMSQYKSRNFDLATIKRVTIDASNSSIHIEIDEAIIESINIEENLITKDWFVRSYFPLKKGEPYSTALASEGIRNIYGTDLFERVTVDAVPSKNGVVVRIRVKEKHTGRLRFGWHWDDEYDSEEFVELLNDNFLGIGLEYKLHASFAPQKKDYSASLKADRIFKTYLTSQFKIYRSEINRQSYNIDDSPLGFLEEKTDGFQISIGQQIERLGTASASLSVEELEIFDSETNITEIFGLRKLKFETLFENFDKMPFPHSGNKHIFSLEFAGKFVGGDAEFTKFYTSHESYIPLCKTFTYHPRLALGASRSGLPSSEQFYLGGIDSFIGFRTDHLSGDKMFIFSNELRINLPLNLYYTARYDLGEVYNSTAQIKLRNLRNAVGVALSLDSPIGPFTFGYGYVNKEIEQVYLNIGFKF